MLGFFIKKKEEVKGRFNGVNQEGRCLFIC